MKIDVFIRNFQDERNIRWDFHMACIGAWQLDPMAKVFTISTVADNRPKETFNWYCRRYAEEHSQSELYIISDDDILPLGKDWIARVVAITEQNPDYVMLVANQVNYSARVKSQGYEVQPREMSGSPMLIRRGMVDWAALAGPGKYEDAIIGKYCKEHELKIGTMVEIECNHIGQGFSVMNPEMWMRP